MKMNMRMKDKILFLIILILLIFGRIQLGKAQFNFNIDFSLPTFNFPSFDFNIETPSIEIPTYTAPQIQIPTVEVPSFQVPEVNLGNFDFNISDIYQFDVVAGGEVIDMGEIDASWSMPGMTTSAFLTDPFTGNSIPFYEITVPEVNIDLVYDLGVIEIPEMNFSEVKKVSLPTTNLSPNFATLGFFPTNIAGNIVVNELDCEIGLGRPCGEGGLCPIGTRINWVVNDGVCVAECVPDESCRKCEEGEAEVIEQGSISPPGTSGYGTWFGAGPVNQGYGCEFLVTSESINRLGVCPSSVCDTSECPYNSEVCDLCSNEGSGIFKCKNPYNTEKAFLYSNPEDGSLDYFYTTISIDSSKGCYYYELEKGGKIYSVNDFCKEGVPTLPQLQLEKTLIEPTSGEISAGDTTTPIKFRIRVKMPEEEVVEEE